MTQKPERKRGCNRARLLDGPVSANLFLRNPSVSEGAMLLAEQLIVACTLPDGRVSANLS